MRVPVFLACFFVMLLGGHVGSFAGNKISQIYYSEASHPKKPEPVIIIVKGKDPGSVNGWCFGNEDEILICEDVEDKNFNQSLPKKYKSVAGFYSDFSFKSYLIFSDKCRHALPYWTSEFPPKYISQRSFRI